MRPRPSNPNDSARGSHNVTIVHNNYVNCRGMQFGNGNVQCNMEE